MSTIKFSKQTTGGGGGPAQQTLEETKKWAKLRRYFEKNGGEGVELDLQVKVVGIKHPHEISMTVNGAKVLTNWGDETPEDKRTKVNDKGKTVPMQPGCLITYEAIQEGIEGLRFYRSGTYSGNEKTPLYRTGNAIYRGKLDGVEVDPDVDFIDKPLLITVQMGKDHDRLTEDGAPAKAGCYWNVRNYKPIPTSGGLNDDDDEPVAAPVARRPTPAAVAVLDDDESVPF